jgi:hypothetical protein
MVKHVRIAQMIVGHVDLILVEMEFVNPILERQMIIVQKIVM